MVRKPTESTNNFLALLSQEYGLSQATCNICGQNGNFTVRVSDDLNVSTYEDFLAAVNLRENIMCDTCGSSSRDRMMIYSFGCMIGNRKPLEQWNADKQIKIFETTGRRGHPPILSRKFDYFNTDYEPDKMKGTFDNRKYADVQSLPYSDFFFDYFLTSDVLEHVRLYEKAFGEIYRVLKNKGAMVLTVPYVHGWEKTLVKVEPRGEEDIFLTEPEYHGGHTLVYRVYGRELLAFLRQVGFTVGYLDFSNRKYAISRQNIILAVKNNFFDASQFIEG